MWLQLRGEHVTSSERCYVFLAPNGSHIEGSCYLFSFPLVLLPPYEPLPPLLLMSIIFYYLTFVLLFAFFTWKSICIPFNHISQGLRSGLIKKITLKHPCLIHSNHIPQPFHNAPFNIRYQVMSFIEIMHLK